MGSRGYWIKSLVCWGLGVVITVAIAPDTAALVGVTGLALISIWAALLGDDAPARPPQDH